jgi:hypothetical protein
VRCSIKNLAPHKLWTAVGIAVLLFLCNLEISNFVVVSVVLYITTTALSSPNQSVNQWIVRHKSDFGKHLNVPFVA